eukprot:CAMPEP_0179050456 /NCGR_PEP_ID=MMETSP0796-20121207/20735_1 /TAXON_ID=73915 /ORGANISM="Pyrodinium bahamense, Strain pbaha01" /LENGTH=109 /DNA_ID=CAMNT_0020746959 /DNA_START=195 /DNA_END=524 /DNA_ORIENTATION=+
MLVCLALSQHVCKHLDATTADFESAGACVLVASKIVFNGHALGKHVPVHEDLVIDCERFLVAQLAGGAGPLGRCGQESQDGQSEGGRVRHGASELLLGSGAREEGRATL